MMRKPAQVDARISYVSEKLIQSGFTLRKAKQERLNAIHFARAIGMSNQVIGEFLGVTEAAVRSLARRHKQDGEG